jgi:hypothetical protein
MSAQPDTDSSLNANKPGSEPSGNAAAADATSTNVAPAGASAPVDDSTLTYEQLQARVKTLSDSLAAATAESEKFRQEWQDLKLRDEALGVEALTVDESKLEDKLVLSVRELYQSEMKRREVVALLDKLLSTSTQMIKTAPNYDPKVQADYEVASRSAKEYLAGRSSSSIPLGSSLEDGHIIDVNPQLNSVVINLGKSQGVKEGMRFILLQGDKQVGVAVVVLVRDVVSAALVQNLKPDVVLNGGDRATVMTQ